MKNKVVMVRNAGTLPILQTLSKQYEEEYKDKGLPYQEVTVEKIIKLSKSDFDSFCSSFLENQGFIQDNTDLMYIDTADDGVTKVWHCLFVICDESDIGILIESEGFYYARYLAVAKKSDIDIWHEVQTEIYGEEAKYER